MKRRAIAMALVNFVFAMLFFVSLGLQVGHWAHLFMVALYFVIVGSNVTTLAQDWLSNLGKEIGNEQRTETPAKG